MVKAYNDIFVSRIKFESPRLICSTARSLLSKLGLSLRHDVKVFEVFMIFIVLGLGRIIQKQILFKRKNTSSTILFEGPLPIKVRVYSI